MINSEKILQQLSQVKLPGAERDVVSAGLISGVTVRDDGGRLRVGFLLEGDASFEALRQQCEGVVQILPEVEHVTAVLTAHSTQAAPPRRQALWNHEPIPGVEKMIAVASGKGGVGKSSIATLLALALARQGKNIGLLDADIYGPSIPTMLGVKQRAEVQDGKLIPEMAHGIKAMSIGMMIGDQAAVMRAPMVTKALGQMLRGTNWLYSNNHPSRSRGGKEIATQSQGGGTTVGDIVGVIPPPAPSPQAGGVGLSEQSSEVKSAGEAIDILIIDMPPGTGDVHLSMVQSAPLAGAIIVTLASKVAVIDAKKSIEMFEKVNVPILGIVENMSYMQAGGAPFGSGGGEQLAEETGYPLLAKLPLEPDVGECLNQGKNPFEEMKGSELLEQMKDIALSLWGEGE